MGRRGGFVGILSAMARESARQQRLVEAAQRKRMREIERECREQERQNRLLAKEEKLRYLESRIEETEELNLEMKENISELHGLLEVALKKNHTIEFSSLRINSNYKSFKLPKNLSTKLPEPCREKFFEDIKPLNWFTKLFPGAEEKYGHRCETAEQSYKCALENHKLAISDREAQILKLKDEHQSQAVIFEKNKKEKNAEIDQFENEFNAGEADAITAYNIMVLEKSAYPIEFPQNFKIAYVPESKELVIDYQFPDTTIIPTISEYKYIKTKDLIEEKPRKINHIKELYQDIVTSITLRTLHEIFDANQKIHVDTVAFNGYVETVDLATGKEIAPFLVSVRATQAAFCEISLSKVDKSVCLRNLGARVSPRSYETQPIKPIVDFNMVDKRFIDQSDILKELDSTQNIYEMNPFEFENLVSNLFSRMGLESKLTRSSKDGGVDAVAFDLRPVLGGKVVIQAKRYKNTVGVSAVRDLYGTMLNEGANKGILVTTSGYGADAFEFSKDKPIELIDGGQLLYMLREVGIEAKIILPND